MGTSAAKTILLLEDSSTIRGMVCTLLAGQGYTVVEAEHGERALELGRDRRFDLLIFDLNVPRMRGLTVARLLRQDSINATTPIFLLTTYISPEDTLEAKDLVSAVILKPYKRDVLLDGIKRVLG